MDALWYSVLLTIVHSISFYDASRILGIFAVMSKSHKAYHEVLMKELASRGHLVTTMSFLDETTSSTPDRLTNYSRVIMSQADGVTSFVDTIGPEQGKEITGIGFYLRVIGLAANETNMCNVIYAHKYVRDIMNGRIPPPDLLITESFHMHCYCSLAEKFDIPVVISVVPTYVPGVDYTVGNPLHPAYLPLVTTFYSQKMNFYQRLINWLHYFSIYAIHHTITTRKMLLFDKTTVGNKDVTVEKLNGRVSLIFLNNHFSFLNRPLVPNAIEIGGMHITDARPLPEDIQRFIEEAKDGVIFFSFGTTLKASSLPREKIEMFKKAFSKIPQRILWRSNVLNLTDVPSNIMIKKWFPQRDILEHKNVKAFISHGGISSTYEALHTGTPVIGIPFFYDQFTNINMMQEKGVAINLDYNILDYETFLNALKNIINDKRYYVNMQKLSSVFNDRPMSPLDTAIYWVEYVIRHKGAAHIRVAAADMPFYKFLLLDVIGFLLISLILVIWLIYYIIRKVVRNYHRLIILPTKKKIQ